MPGDGMVSLDLFAQNSQKIHNPARLVFGFSGILLDYFLVR